MLKIQAKLNRVVMHDKMLKRKVDRQENRVLYIFGSFVRMDVRSKELNLKGKRKTVNVKRNSLGQFQSGLKVKQHSKAGERPRQWQGLLRKFMLYDVDKFKKSVVIGAKKLGRSRGAGLMEHGGSFWYRLRKKHTGQVHRGTATVSARPFMQRQFDRNLKKLPDIYRRAGF